MLSLFDKFIKETKSAVFAIAKVATLFTSKMTFFDQVRKKLNSKLKNSISDAAEVPHTPLAIFHFADF